MTEQLTEYKTISSYNEVEQVINKSRFISRIYPITSEEEAKEIIAAVKKEHYKATHVCSAWILATKPKMQKASDDGEPSGTAGKPILQVIEANNLKNVLVVVIRYFGGIKLGAGGLIRAYSGGAAQVINDTPLSYFEPTDTISIQTEYSFYEPLKLELEKRNILADKEEFSDVVELTFDMPVALTTKFIDLIKDFTNDNYLAEILQTTSKKRPYNNKTILL